MKASIGEWGGKSSVNSSFYFCEYFRCGWCKQQNTKTIHGHSKGSKCPDTNIFELLILKHDRAHVNVESDESMCVIMKWNTVTRYGLRYTKYITRSITLIRLTKHYLRTTAIILKIRERILRRICFEIKNNCNFYVSTICGPFEGKPRSKYFQCFPP